MTADAPPSESCVQLDKAADLKAAIARKLDEAGADLQAASLQAAIVRALACRSPSAPLARTADDKAASPQAAGDQDPGAALQAEAPELPSSGSAKHGSGTCKPCAFFHTKGCANGENCAFCHLCDVDEKKQRQKQRWEQKRRAWRALRHQSRIERRLALQEVEDESAETVSHPNQIAKNEPAMLLGPHSVSHWSMCPPGLFADCAAMDMHGITEQHAQWTKLVM